MASGTTTNDEKYFRLGLMLVKGGTKIARALFEKCFKAMTPEDHVPFPWTIDEFLQANKKTILSSQTGRANKRILFPFDSGTKIDDWDLYMFCFVLVDVCGVSRTIRMDVDQLKKIRNKLSHLSEASVDNDKYKSYVDKIEVIFDRLLLEINEQALKEEITDVLNAAKEGPLSIQDTIKVMHKFYSMEGEWREILSEHNKDIKEVMENVREILRNQMRYTNQMPHEIESEKVPETIIELLIKNCVSDKEAVISKQLVDMIKEAICSSSTGKHLKEEYSKIKEAVRDTVEKFIAQGRVIVDAEERCVLLKIKCTSVASLLSLFDDCISGDIDNDFKQLETCIREIGGYEQVTLEAVMFEEEFWRTISQTVSSLQEISRTYSTAYRSSTGSQNSDISTMSDVKLVERLSPTTEDEKRIHHAVRLTIRTDKDGKNQLKESVKNGSFDSSVNRLKEEIIDHYDLTKLSIEARVLDEELLTQEDADQVLFEEMKVKDKIEQSCKENSGSIQKHLQNTGSRSKREYDNLDKANINSLGDIKDRQYLIPLLKQGKDYLGCKNVETEIDQIRETLKHDAKDREMHENETELTDLFQQSKQYRVKEVKHMAAKNISRLIQEAQDAAATGEERVAKQKALQAILGIDIEKNKVLTGQKTDISEQQLGEWYGGCSFVMNKIGEYVTATKCFFTATIFDPTWDLNAHRQVSQVLWTSLVFSKDQDDLKKDYKEIRRLLIELDDLAKLAENRGKLGVCTTIDGDINRIYSHFMRVGLVDLDLIKQPGRKESMWRTARCFLRMGMHDDARKICSTILQHACNYDDPEAFEIWAASLCSTGDFDIALEKCELALNYCKDDVYKQRLEAFCSKIKEQLAASHESDQSGDIENTNNSATDGSTSTEKNKKQNRKAKAYAQSGQNSEESKDESNSSLSTSERSAHGILKKVLEAMNEDGFEQVICKRSRQSSICSTMTTLTDDSGFDKASQFDNSDIEWSTEDERNDYSSSSSEENSDINFVPDLDLEKAVLKEEMSFYEQSLRFYQQDDEGYDNLGKPDSDKNLLKYGIKLNMSYLHQFEDKNPDIVKRDHFYPQCLSENQLRQKMLQNPKKYVKCVIQLESSHEAICTPVDTHDSIHVIEISGRSKIGQVFNEDEVVVEILDEPSKDKKEKRFGKVIGILNRQRHKGIKHPVFICTLDDMDSKLVRPICKTIPKIRIIDRKMCRKYKSRVSRRYKIETYNYESEVELLCNPKIINLNPAEQKSYIFLVAFIQWGPRHIYPRGAIIKILPTGLSESTGLTILNLQHDVPSLYSKATVDQIKSSCSRLGNEPSDQLLQGRLDLTKLNTFTIDQRDSKDLEYALSVDRIEEGYKVGVHIADVATYVPKDSPLDEESRQRATTFYPGIRRPRNMLPEPFSTNVCSLLPGKVRLSISLFFYLTGKGRPVQLEGGTFEIISSFIKSKRQLSYGEAQDIIRSPGTANGNAITKDIKLLYKIAKEVRKRRLGNAMFAMDLDREESEQEESISQTVEAHYLVEEFMIMSNEKVANWLLSQKSKGYKQCVPLCCQRPPSKENMQEFLQSNNCHVDILLRLQDKQLGPKKPDFRECLKENTKTIMVRENVWQTMKESQKTASDYIRTDDLHPLQLTIYQHWLAFQERVVYRCSGSINGEEDGIHSSLNLYPYTHFTSPIRRYNDLIVHRLVHAALENRPCPYEKVDIDNICVHINSVAKKAKKYEKGCKALQKAIELRTTPRMLIFCVDDVSDRGVTLFSPLLEFVSKPHRELTFSLLDMGHKPETIEDPNTKWNTVKATWKKRLYDCNEQINQPDNGIMFELNPQRGVIFLPLYEWARMLLATTEENENDLSRAITNAKVLPPCKGFDDVTTECNDPLKIRPNTKFSMIFSRGQQLKVQMSASPNKGIITPKPVLLSMTDNVKFCLQHTENPVLHLYRYVTRSTCNKYQNVREYLERWIPIILMESATGIVSNEETYCINNVDVKFLEDRKGTFTLGLNFCEIRNIIMADTLSGENEKTADDEKEQSYDWLCLKAFLPTKERTVRYTTTSDFEDLHSVWIGHATIIYIVKRKSKIEKEKTQKSDENVQITFQLHEKTPDLPSNFPTNTQFSVEILKKSDVEKRTETFMKALSAQSDSLAAKIALNKPIPDFDRSRAHIASLRHNQDLFFDLKYNDPKKSRHLPRNNPLQQEAINKALTSRFSLIQGPPGTGKTYTGIKLMYFFDKINSQMNKEGHGRKQVLFCGPSNKSVDLVAKCMLQKMEHFKPNFIRVYGQSTELIDFPIPGRECLSKRSTRSSNTDDDLKSVSLHHLIRQKDRKYAEEINARDRFFKNNNYEPMPELVKEYVNMVIKASIEEIQNYDVILCTTAVGADPRILRATNVYQVIVDGAGMCQEPQCLVPIIAAKAEQVVLIGDHMQLRPIIKCKEAAQLGLEKSLFERYATSDSSTNVQFTMLTQQYRMNPELCRFPSKLFYENALKTMRGAWTDTTLNIWPQGHKGVYPHVFVHVEGEEQTLTVSTEDWNLQSRSNEAEIDHVIKTYKYLAREEPNESIHILSQYNAQCSEIKRRLKNEGFDKLDERVSTVVSSPGGEWAYVIFSTVRSLPDYKIEKNPTLGWCTRNLGFVTDRNQVNVALTRAQKGLIIIGNKNLLAGDYVWKRLIQHYDQRGCLKTTEEFPPKNIRKTRMQIMEEAQARTNRRYGESMFEKRPATLYKCDFDEEFNVDDIWDGRFAKLGKRKLEEVHDSTMLSIKRMTDDVLDVWPKVDEETFPNVFVHIEGEEKRISEDDLINMSEIEHVVKMYDYFNAEGVGNSIQILSQSSAQCSEIKRRLGFEYNVTETNFDAVVCTVEESQGLEWDYIIYSTVRSLPEDQIIQKAKVGWRRFHLGSLMDRQEVNVALTRAKKGLVIIGNKNMLSCDSAWKDLIQYYEDRGCVKTPREFPPTEDDYSTIEAPQAELTGESSTDELASSDEDYSENPSIHTSHM